MDDITLIVLLSDFDDVYEMRRTEAPLEEEIEKNERLFIPISDGNKHIT